jgi:hypothetical protein
MLTHIAHSRMMIDGRRASTLWNDDGMQSYRARSSLVWGWLTVGLGVFMVVSDSIAYGLTGAKVGLWLGACIAMIGAAAFLRPAVVVTADSVVFRNLVYITSAPMARIQDFSMQWSFEMHGDDGMKTGAFAVPASRGARTGVFGAELPGATRSDRTEANPNSIGSQVYAAWQERTNLQGGATDRSSPSMTRRLDVVGLMLVLGSIAALALAFFG